MLLYHFVWTICLIFCLPALWILRRTHRNNGKVQRLVERTRERLSLGLPRVSRPGGGIWIHALSVGEVISAVPLVYALEGEFPERPVVFTVTTVTGMAVAREKLGPRVSTILTMPVDAWWCVERMIRFLRPAVFILIETDIWPGVLSRLKARGVRSILVNGRISPRTFKGYSRVPFLARRLFAPFHLCLMQSDLDRARLLRVGLDRARVVTVGNIKSDREMEPMGKEERDRWFADLALKPSDPLWVAGSTHPGEEEALFQVFKRLCPSFPRLRLVVAPRDTARAREIVKTASRLDLKALLRTEIPEAFPGSGNPPATPLTRPERDEDYHVLVLDTIGELGRIYALGKVSFVGGSLVPIGGHNLLEPASWGKVVLFGPHTRNFVAMSEALLQAGGGWRVKDEEGLYQAMKALLQDEKMLRRMGDRARGFVEDNQGALRRVVHHVKESMTHGT